MVASNALGFILLPLYIYPESTTTWSPLLDAASAYPSVTFNAVVNVDNGPYSASSSGTCPPSDYANAVGTLNAASNINVIGYVHTAYEYTCDTICSCSAPLADLEANVTIYNNWATECTTDAGVPIEVNGIFIDEAPSDSDCYEYMSNATSFVKSSLVDNGNTVFFNPGAAVVDEYFDLADFINVFENNEVAYDGVSVGSLDDDGVYSRQSTLLIYGYDSDAATLKTDVTTILSYAQDSIAGLYISDLSTYAEFPTIWDEFVDDVNGVVESNAAAS